MGVWDAWKKIAARLRGKKRPPVAIAIAIANGHGEITEANALDVARKLKDAREKLAKELADTKPGE